MDTKGKLIYQKIKEKGLKIETCCEVGVYLPETSNVINFIEEGLKTILVEPEPTSIRAIKQKFKDNNNVLLHEVAVFDRKGHLELSKFAASTFVTELPYSPATINNQYERKASDSLQVPCEKFSSLDPGNIDLLSIDTEGCEWYVLQDLISTPQVISIETHGKLYINPYMKEIQNWLDEHQYEVWFKDKSDTVYFQSGLMNLTFSDKLDLLMINFKLNTTRFIKLIARTFLKK